MIVAVTADPEYTRKSTAWSPIHPSRNQWPSPDICKIASSVGWSVAVSDQSTDRPADPVSGRVPRVLARMDTASVLWLSL